MVVKFINVKAETAEKLDIANVKLYGYEIDEHNLESNRLVVCLFYICALYLQFCPAQALD